MSTDRAGLLSGLAGYAFWGVAPIYFMWVQFASPTEVLAHRIVWAAALLLPGLFVLGQQRLLRNLKTTDAAWLALSALLLSFNWLVFVWSLFNGRMLEASLGYYINPLMTVVLGVVFLGERPRRGQWFAVGIAACAIAHEILARGVVPYAGLSLAVSFALYGLVRRKVGLPSAFGLAAETVYMLPFALAYLVWLSASGDGALARGDGAELALLALGGPVTIFPLLCFAYAALRVPFTVLGFLQYLAPSLTFLLAIYVYGEPIDATRLATFVLIWAAVVWFSLESLFVSWKKTEKSHAASG